MVDSSLCLKVQNIDFELLSTFLPLSSIDRAWILYTKDPQNLTLISWWAMEGIDVLYYLAYHLKSSSSLRSRNVGLFHDGVQGSPVFFNATSLFFLDKLYDHNESLLQSLRNESCENAAKLYRMHDLLVNISGQDRPRPRWRTLRGSGLCHNRTGRR